MSQISEYRDAAIALLKRLRTCSDEEAHAISEEIVNELECIMDAKVEEAIERLRKRGNLR